MYPDQQQGYNQPIMTSNLDDGMLQYQIESNEIIDEIEHLLKGEALNYNQGSGDINWVSKGIGRPLINDKGINSVVTILKSHLTKIFVLSDFEEEDVRNITISVGENIIDELYFNWEEYEVPSPSAASMIVNIITHTVYATLRKGYLGNYLKFLKTAQRITEVQTFSEGQKNNQGMPMGMDKPSFLGFLKRK